MREESKPSRGPPSPDEEPISLSESESVVTGVLVVSSPESVDGSHPSPPLCSRCRGEIAVHVDRGVQTDLTEPQQEQQELNSPKRSRRSRDSRPEYNVCDTRAPLPPAYGRTTRQRETEMRKLLFAKYSVEDLTCFVVERPNDAEEPRFFLTPQKGTSDDHQLSSGETLPTTSSRLASRTLVECKVLLGKASPKFISFVERVLDKAYVQREIPSIIEGHQYLVLASLSAIFSRRLYSPAELINSLLLGISPAKEGCSSLVPLPTTELDYHENESMMYGAMQSGHDHLVSAVDRGFKSILLKEATDHINRMQQTVSPEFPNMFTFVDEFWPEFWL